MKYILTTLLFIVCSFSANSQDSGGLFVQNIDAHIDIIPLTFPDPSIRFGSEMMLGNRWSTGLNLGIGVPMPRNMSLGFREPKWNNSYNLFEIRPEVKFYWLKRERMGWYVAAEGLFSTMNGSTRNSYHFVEGNDTLQVDFEKADFRKTKVGLIGKMGGRFLLGERFTLDFFSGLGLSNTSSAYENYVGPTFGRSDPFFEGENYTAGKRIIAHVSFGLRLGMIVWRKETHIE